MNKKSMLLILFCIFLDQLTKFLVAKFLTSPVSVIGDFLVLEKNMNEGIAFGIEINRSVVMILTLVMLFLILKFMKKELNMKKNISKAAAVLVIGGAVGNFIDRLINGSVIDFISIKYWPTFNLADMFIVAGVLIVIIFYKRISNQRRN